MNFLAALFLGSSILGVGSARPGNPSVIAQFDTTIAVSASMSLAVMNTAGRITVKVWNRPAVRITTTARSDDPIEVRMSASVLEVRTRSSRGVSRPSISVGPGGTVSAKVEVRQNGGPLPRVDYEIIVPATMALDIAGIYSDVVITGTRAAVHATAVHGDLSLSGGSGSIRLENLEGKVQVDGARGSLVINAPNNSVSVSNPAGEVNIKSVNGGVSVTGNAATNVSVRTYNGSVELSGNLSSGGSYSVSTFNGDVRLVVPSTQGATVNVVTIKGRVMVSKNTRSNISVNKRGTIILGNGGAKVELETFDGDVHVIAEGRAK